MRPFLLSLLLVMPAAAQWESIEIRFEGIGCASCLDSLPSRIERIRGVTSVAVDAGLSLVTVRLEAPNRARVEQIRDFIEQDGTKATQATLTGCGPVAQEDGRWSFRPDGRTAYWLELDDGIDALADGSIYRVNGFAGSLRPADGRIVIRVVLLKPADPPAAPTE